MATTDTGHAKNVADFKRMNAACTTYGLTYNPSNVNIKVTALNTKATACDTAVKAVEPLKKPYKDAIDARKATAGFGNLNNIVRSSFANLSSCDGVSATTLSDARAYVKKITGTNRNAKTVAPAGTEVTEPAPATYSTSQQSFDMRLANFVDYIALLAATPQYNPNEADIKVTALTTYATGLTTFNATVESTYIPYEVALKNRDMALYAPNTGLVDLAAKVKKYVSGITALSLTEKQLVTSLSFSKPSKKYLHL